MERLREDATCSICLDVLNDPVSIECSHNFCRGCLAAHWSGVSAWASQCPECRAPCSRDRMIPDTRLRALVEKITEPLREEMEPQGPGAQPELGHPVQLVRLDEEGDLILDEEALNRCLEQGAVGAAPVCLVSIIGEQRRGKSFLMNYLLRRLQRQNQERMALGGFECRAGTATVTKGVCMWGQPLWVQAKGRKVAVFLVDTEGSLDLQRRMETSIKLSVFSILLSSYWIFNISSTFTRTEADYLEMFVHVAKEVGETCNLPPIQRLDLLVRDWQLSGAYGAKEGRGYLRDITRDLEDSAEQPLVLGALRARGTRCYLLPQPGSGFTKSRAGTPGDMDEDFRQCLQNYVTSVVRSAGTHVRTDRAGQVLTGAQLAARIKGVSRYLKTKCYDFSSPVKMAEAFAAMRQEKNSKAVEAARREYEQFVQELAGPWPPEYNLLPEGEA
ncbi:RING finger protein 112-like [Mauremys mutica]|uniref:RING finger protein 112-like n=1 Tax=Mauremys mutica TaxID=74926 RepID=UPI001D161E81|nr:RING finger protein 112-like [Mauremys mutica]